jgi:hypothetical protein
MDGSTVTTMRGSRALWVDASGDGARPFQAPTKIYCVRRREKSRPSRKCGSREYHSWCCSAARSALIAFLSEPNNENIESHSLAERTGHPPGHELYSTELLFDFRFALFDAR